MRLEDVENKSEIHGAFFDMAYSPFVILDQDLNFIDVNQAAVSTLGIKKKDFVGKNILEVFPYLQKTNRYEAYKKVIETGEPIGFDELTFKGVNSNYKFLLRAFKIGNGLGISTLDITHLVKSMDELKESQTKVESINKNLEKKNQELSEYSYVVAHDLRAPLTNIHMLLDMLESDNSISLEGMPVFEKVKKVAKIMCDKLKALNKVIALKSEVNFQKEDIQFKDVLSKIKLTHSEEIVQARIIIKENFTSAPVVNYNAVQLESILHNLVSNSIKYRHPKRTPVISLKTRMVDGVTVLTIKDNGIGFDSTNLDKIFGLFKRMHTHVEGLGVGLYILNSIVKQNGGELEVDSKVNQGTEFKIKL